MFSWHALDMLISISHHLNVKAYLSIVGDYVHPLMATINPTSNGYLQYDNAPGHKAKVALNWFHGHNGFSVFPWPSQSTNLKSIEHLLDGGRTVYSQYKSTPEKHAVTVLCNHVNMDRNVKEMFQIFCGIHAAKN